jgi:hypothetical protein
LPQDKLRKKRNRKADEKRQASVHTPASLTLIASPPPPLAHSSPSNLHFYLLFLSLTAHGVACLLLILLVPLLHGSGL